MKKSTFWSLLLFAVVVVAVIIYIRENNKSDKVQSDIANNNKIRKDQTTSATVCQPCSTVDLKAMAFVIINRPEVNKFRSGRSVNTSNAQKRYNNGQNILIPLCYTNNVKESIVMERHLNTVVAENPKCENKARDARGKTARDGITNFLYVKYTEHTSLTGRAA